MATETLPLSVQTLYADLLQSVLSGSAARPDGNLPGSFVAKTIKGKKYWYLQFNELGKKRQVYLGPDGPQTASLIAGRRLRDQRSRDDARLRESLCRMIVQGGGLALDNTSARILELLAKSGLFEAGAVLVGSHAFICYGNALGVRWRTGMRTQDIDLAYDKSLAVVVGERGNLDLGSALRRAQTGFLPVPALNPKHPSTSFKMRGKELHLDMLTPWTGHGDAAKPIHLHALGLAAQPLRYLDYLIESPEKAVVLFRDGIPVNVPQPARFFWHKLIVIQERSSHWKTKIAKDKAQCAQLAEALDSLRPHDLETAWDDLGGRNKAWQRYAKKGLDFLLRDHSHLLELRAIRDIKGK